MEREQNRTRSSSPGRRPPARQAPGRGTDRNTGGRTSGGRNQGRKKSRTKLSLPMIGIIAAAAALLVLAVILVRGCGSTHKSAVNVSRALVEAEFDGSVSKMKDCYGIEGEIPGDLQKDMNASIDYLKAHGAKSVSIKNSGLLFERTDYSYVYVYYTLDLENGQAYPCIETFMVEKLDGKFYVLTPAKITDEMSLEAVDAYKKFMTSDVYKDYTKEYETFIKKNPGYEDKIAGKLA